MRILLVSPYHGHSSHASWAEGYRASSRHQVEILSLSDRAWAWRLKGGAVELAQKATTEQFHSDVVLATSMTDVAGLMGHWRGTPLAAKPVVLYMHENQLTYPIRKEGKRDRQLPWIQYSSMLCADEIWFNSEHNRTGWFRALPSFLASLPDAQGVNRIESLFARSKVVPVGLNLPKDPPALERDEESRPPLLVWNQRWDCGQGPRGVCGRRCQFAGEGRFSGGAAGTRAQKRAARADPL